MIPDHKRSVVKAVSHRLIASQYPTIGVFDDLTQDPEELRAAFLLESMTNDRFLLLQRRISLLPNGEISSGYTSSYVMSAFLHADEQGGRFNSGNLGAWYASLDVQTAIHETLYHSDRRLRLSESAFPSKIQMRELIANIYLEFVDIRGMQIELSELYDADPSHYPRSQIFGDRLRWPENENQKENGIVYDSVRSQKGENICIFWPSLVPLPIIQGDHYEYNWDKNGNTHVLKLTNVPL